MMVVADVATMNQARRLHDAVSEVNDAYSRNARRLEQIRYGIHLTSILVRDYLQDPREQLVPRYSIEMKETRVKVDKQVDELFRSMPRREGAKLQEMRDELSDYWSSLDPVFAWTPQEKGAYSFQFLRDRVIPKRESVLNLTADLEAFNDSALDQQRNEIAKRETEFNSFLQRVVLLSLVIGLTVAFAVTYRVSQLESRNKHQHERTQRAEAQMRKLSQQLVHAQEEERKAISRELHDEIGQMLTGLRMEFRSLAHLHGAPEQEFKSRIDQGKMLLDQALQAVRDIAMGLRPSMLDDLGLEAALQWQARDFCRRHDIPVNLTVHAPLEDLPDQHKTNLYRIVQEALTNCARHSQAKSIAISIRRQDTELRVTVSDDGVGLQSNKQGGGLGLIGIQERARELGGTIAIESGADLGTRLTVSIPAERSAVVA
ncbi:MAG TPA: sensor histidine kinase [Bryobacteraceae bacterium]|nr:sensor histidine kinase [Bryobacteraceae bacterium]